MVAGGSQEWQPNMAKRESRDMDAISDVVRHCG